MGHTQRCFASLLSALLALPALGADQPATPPAPGACEGYAAMVDGVPLDNQMYQLLERAAARGDTSVYRDAPIDGGRYWTRADYADGISASRYAHYGCFADVRYLIAWFCQADKSWVAKQYGCLPKRLPGLPVRATSGCSRLRIGLREPIVYCAPGSSPQLAAER